MSSLTAEGLWEAGPGGDVTDSVAEVEATTGLVVVEDGGFDLSEGRAASAGIAREDDEDDIDVTINTLDDSLELVDGATGHGGHVVNREVVDLLEDDLILLSFVLLPGTSRRCNQIAESVVLGPAAAGDTSVVVPIPLALRVGVARSLIVSKLEAE